MREVETLIVGAGISGLATAAALGPEADVLVLERDEDIGGYCKTVIRDGFVWDYSGHFFHFRHPEIEQWLRARMAGQTIRTIKKRSFISWAGGRIDFPFQKNIHQLPQADFIDCLHDLYVARADAARGAHAPEANFKDMLFNRYGRGIAERFLIPYNEKLYATDLATLDRDAMGRFFPHADVDAVVRNMKKQDNASYNDTFTYPAGGAIEYIKAIASAVRPDAVHCNEAVTGIDLKSHVARTSRGEYRFRRLISSAPLPKLYELCGVPFAKEAFSWNQVLVFNLGFDAKGPSDLHWLYVPDRRRPFYRVGFYDNIFEAPRMSLYVEVGLKAGASFDLARMRESVLQGLRDEGIVTTQKLVAEHSVVMNPAYVHITQPANAERLRLQSTLAAADVHSIGRYGGWTYCSIEDNIVEARQLATRLGIARAWPWPS